MLYLMLAILSSSSIAIIFRFSEHRNMNRYAVTCANYIMACLVSAVLFWISGIQIPKNLFELSPYAETVEIVISSAEIIRPDLYFAWTVQVGAGAGIFFFLAFIYYQLSVRKHGVGLAGAFAKLGITIPMALSLIIWREYPSNWQWAGIVLSFTAIIIVNWPQTGKLLKNIRYNLIFLLFFGGLAEFSNKFFQKYAIQSYKPVFLGVTFFTAFCFSVISLLIKNRDLRKSDFFLGLALGIPNLFSSFFLILALDSIPAAAAFPVFAAGTILVITITGRWVFGEQMTRLEEIAMMLIVISLILVNIN